MYHPRPHNDGLCVVDFGSQYTQLIARKLREQGVYCESFPPTDQKPDFGFTVRGIILSGGPDTVSDTTARSLPDWVLTEGVPVLGICYGMQLLVGHFGGEVRAGHQREYGRAQITKSSHNHPLLWPGFDAPHEVWMSHGDHIARLPENFHEVARTSRTTAACADSHGRIIGLQYHPEVEHTQGGSEFLAYFAEKICQIECSWQPKSMLAALELALRQQVRHNTHILVACSGGVDSTVTLALLTKVFGKERVQGVFVDTGLLRWDDLASAQATASQLSISLEVVPAADLFYTQLEQQTCPETKRKIIGSTFIDVFKSYTDQHQDRFDYLAQGTLYSDVIESGYGGVAPRVIKTHHNVGGLPDAVPFEILEPFRFLFKDEVRQLGAELGIHKDIIWQHPFPGPGLGVRIAGEVNRKRVAIVQQADKIFINYLKEKGLYNQIWQAFCVLLPIKSVGVMGDQRTYEWVVSLRAVTSCDAMTAKVAALSIEDLSCVAEQIVSCVKGVNRVLYDVTTKPPATIEWQ